MNSCVFGKAHFKGIVKEIIPGFNWEYRINTIISGLSSVRNI